MTQQHQQHVRASYYTTKPGLYLIDGIVYQTKPVRYTGMLIQLNRNVGYSPFPTYEPSANQTTPLPDHVIYPPKAKVREKIPNTSPFTQDEEKALQGLQRLMQRRNNTQIPLDHLKRHKKTIQNVLAKMTTPQTPPDPKSPTDKHQKKFIDKLEQKSNGTFRSLGY